MLGWLFVLSIVGQKLAATWTRWFFLKQNIKRSQDLEFFRQRVDDLEEQLRQRDQALHWVHVEVSWAQWYGFQQHLEVVMDLMSQLKKAEIESQSSKDDCDFFPFFLERVGDMESDFREFEWTHEKIRDLIVTEWPKNVVEKRRRLEWIANHDGLKQCVFYVISNPHFLLFSFVRHEWFGLVANKNSRKDVRKKGFLQRILARRNMSKLSIVGHQQTTKRHANMPSNILRGTRMFVSAKAWKKSILTARWELQIRLSIQHANVPGSCSSKINCMQLDGNLDGLVRIGMVFNQENTWTSLNICHVIDRRSVSPCRDSRTSRKRPLKAECLAGGTLHPHLPHVWIWNIHYLLFICGTKRRSTYCSRLVPVYLISFCTRWDKEIFLFLLQYHTKIYLQYNIYSFTKRSIFKKFSGSTNRARLCDLC